MPKNPQLLFTLALLFVMANAGCNSQSTIPQSAEHEQAGHSHSAEGPHQGQLIELGSDKYHAELVKDDVTGTVTIYILDSTAEKTVPVDNSEIVINIAHESHGDQFQVAAKPAEDDPAGKTSRFVSEDKTLLGELDHGHADAQLVITIEGRQYRGKIARHAHD